MKRVLFILLATMCVVLGASAQDVRPQRTPEQEAQRRVEMMAQHLQLSATQVEQLYQLQLKYARLRRKATVREDFVRLMHALIDEIEQVLTKEQFAVYTSWLEGRKQKHVHTFGRPAPTNTQGDSLGGKR